MNTHPTGRLLFIFGEEMNDDLISAYREVAKRHGEGTRTGNADATNLAYDELAALLKIISNSQADAQLFQLFDDPDIWVQLWAAAHTLEMNERKARKKLQLIRDAEVPLVSLTAKYTLMEWEKGTLSFRT